MVSVAMCGMGPGLFFEQETAQFEVNQSTILNGRATAIEVGDVVTLELVGTSYEKVKLSSSRLPSQLVGIALEAANHGETVRVGLRGEFKCKCRTGVGRGDEVTVVTTSGWYGTLADPADTPAEDPVAYLKLIGVAQEAAASDGALTVVFFDGITGIMGTHN